jgi:hypothetical protein
MADALSAVGFCCPAGQTHNEQALSIHLGYPSSSALLAAKKVAKPGATVH